MNWLRHPNGGGHIIGNDVETSADSFIDHDSVIDGDSNIYHCWIEDSHITDCRPLVGACIVDSRLINCRTWNAPVIEGVNLTQVAVFGNAHLIGPWNLDAPIRIHTGTWRSPPQWDLIKGNNIEVGISKCTEDRFHIGCSCKTYAIWTRQSYRERIGARAGWTPDQIELAYKRFTEWR